MFKWEKIEGGIRKYYNWGFSEVFMPNLVDCFSLNEITQLIEHYKKVIRTRQEQEFLDKLEIKRQQLDAIHYV